MECKEVKRVRQGNIGVGKGVKNESVITMQTSLATILVQ